MVYDLAIIGSGGGAFAAAIAARRKDRRVVMVERAPTGGTCVNAGCVPSKALLAAAEARHTAAAHPFPGIGAAGLAVDFPALIGGKRQLVEGLRADKYVDLAAEYGWDLVAGRARFADGPVLEVDGVDGGTERVEAEHYVIATGSAPWAPPIDGLAESGYLTSTTAMELDQLPASLIVVGGNYVGLELAQLFSHLGTRVTVVEALERLAPAEEPEISQAIEGVFTDDGIGVHTDATITRVHRAGEQVTASLRDHAGAEHELQADHILVATGRRPVTAGLNLEAVGVKIGDRGEVLTDDHLRTTNPRVWAVGDVTGHPQFVYVAGAHGVVVADNALDGADRTLDYTHLPRVTFTSPAIAGAGLTDTQANHHGIACECRVLPLEHVPRALVNRDTRGLVKIVAEQGTGRVVGVSMIADGAGDAIQAGVYAIKNRMTTTDMVETWAPYLTMSEALKLAAQTFTRDVAKLSCCAS